MFSFKERLSSFKNWPKEYYNLAQKLAIIGQYSTEPKTLSTCCYYCQVEHSNWTLSENPFMCHLNENSLCPIYKLTNKTSRRALSLNYKPFKKVKEEVERLVENNFVQLNIDEIDSFYCLKCGSSDLKHKCSCIKVQRITENMDIGSAQFYIKYLNGDFIPEIMKIINSSLTFTEEQKKVITELMNEYCRGEPFETFEHFLRNCSESIYLEVEKRMKKIEKDAYELMYSESIML